MKKIPFKISFLLLSFVLLFNSCNKDDDATPDEEEEPVETTVAEDKQNIEEAFDQIVQCADEVRVGRLVSLIQTTFDIRRGEGETPAFLEALVDSLPSVFDFETIETDEAFDLSFHSGTYTYDRNNSQLWTRTDNSSGEIVVLFPSTENGSNDLNLTVSGYQDERFNFDGDQVALPTSLSANFSQNGTTLVEVVLNSVQYEELQTVTIPIFIDLDIILAPLTIDVVARRVNPTLFDMNLTMTNGGSCNLTAFAEVKLNNDDLENLINDDVDYIRGYVQHGDMRISADIDYDNLAAFEDPTLNQFNMLGDVDLLISGQKVADINLVEVNNNEELHAVYKDGTSQEVTEAYLIPFVENLEVALFDLLGNFE